MKKSNKMNNLVKHHELTPELWITKCFIQQSSQVDSTTVMSEKSTLIFARAETQLCSAL